MSRESGGSLLRPRDAILIAALLAVAIGMMVRAGFEFGSELAPIDAVEYAAMASNLDRGLGPVLRFGGHSYPARYSGGYPLMLAAAWPLFRAHPQYLWVTTAALALLAITLLYLLTLRAFGRASAFAAALLLAVSPVFVAYSTMVMSDIPELAVTLLVVVASLAALGSGSVFAWGVSGLLAGYSAILRPTNVAILAGVAAAAATAPRKISLGATSAFIAAFLLFPAWQMAENVHRLGSPLANGYSFWAPGWYGSGLGAFNPRFLFAPAQSDYVHGNVLWYASALMGLDGAFPAHRALGRMPIARAYALYPFAAAAFAVFGATVAIRKREEHAVRLIAAGLAYLAALVLIYLFYFWIDFVFILPAAFIIFALAGYGIALANRELWPVLTGEAQRASSILIAIAIAAGDALLAISILANTPPEMARVLNRPPIADQLVSIREKIEPHSIVISDFSNQWLDLFLANSGSHAFALNTVYVETAPSSDIHVHVLYQKRSHGWSGPVPPVLFASPLIDSSEANALAARARSGQALYLLMSANEPRDYGRLLEHEMRQLGDYFSYEKTAQTAALVLFRLRPH